MNKKAIIIGSGFGGLSLAIRLEAMGFETTILEKLDKAGGRGYQKIENVDKVGDFKFDMGPTVLTVPHFIEELFALEKGAKFTQDYPVKSLETYTLVEQKLPRDFSQNGKSLSFSETDRTKDYVNIVPITPFYRLHFPDGTFFDYDGIYQNTIDQIRELTNEDEVEAYKEFFKKASKVFKEGFLNLGYTHFDSVGSMLEVIPKMLKLKSIRSLFKYTSIFFKHPKAKFIFSFETLLVGGNPLSVPALYVMIHFVESVWGIHYAMGGTGALTSGFVKKFQELGGQIKYNCEVNQILMEGKKAVGVKLANGEQIMADIVCSNADYGETYGKLVKSPSLWESRLKVNKFTNYSNSLFVLYFGFKKGEQNLDKLKHHNIILGGDYEQELKNIYNKSIVNEVFSQYLHIPTFTDPSMAPEGYHAAYTLVVVPNQQKIRHKWEQFSPEFADKIIKVLDEQNYIPGLQKNIVHKSWINPDYFENKLNSYFGNSFGVTPVFAQSAYFRPHNKSRGVKNLYGVGASYQPGAGTPSVMMSAKMTARLIAKDFNIEV
jgi:phytoene desaturase